MTGLAWPVRLANLAQGQFDLHTQAIAPVCPTCQSSAQTRMRPWHLSAPRAHGCSSTDGPIARSTTGAGRRGLACTIRTFEGVAEQVLPSQRLAVGWRPPGRIRRCAQVSVTGLVWSANAVGVVMLGAMTT